MALYATEKLRQATSSMATDKGTLQERLYNAFLIFHPLQETNFPNEFIDEWNFIHQSLRTFDQPSDNGQVYETIIRLSDETCEDIINRICSLAFNMD